MMVSTTTRLWRFRPDRSTLIERLIDCLREDDAVQKKIFVDVDRLVAAQLDD